MGCGGSKQDVATGNVVRHRILRKKSDAPKPNTGDTITQTDINNAVAKPLETSETGVVKNDGQTAVDVKDITVNTDTNKEEGKLVSGESPDHYFSSRKDAEVIEAVVAGEGPEYYTPRAVETTEKKDLNEDLKGGEEKDGGAIVVENENGATKMDEISNEKECVDLKETILVEEPKAGDTIIPDEKKNSIVSETTEEDETKESPNQPSVAV